MKLPSWSRQTLLGWFVRNPAVEGVVEIPIIYKVWDTSHAGGWVALGFLVAINRMRKKPIVVPGNSASLYPFGGWLSLSDPNSKVAGDLLGIERSRLESPGVKYVV